MNCIWGEEQLSYFIIKTALFVILKHISLITVSYGYINIYFIYDCMHMFSKIGLMYAYEEEQSVTEKMNTHLFILISAYSK